MSTFIRTTINSFVLIPDFHMFIIFFYFSTVMTKNVSMSFGIKKNKRILKTL